MRNAYIKALGDMAQSDERILSLVADNGAIVFDEFREKFEERFINFGISEANMVSAAAGLANKGRVPFAYTIAGFITMRAYEQVRNDVCIQNQNVKLVGVGAGMKYSVLGPTHHALEDIAIMRVLPNMKIIVPASPLEAYQATLFAASIDSPVYIRLESTKEPEIFNIDYKFRLGKASIVCEGTDIAFIAMGSIINDVLEASKRLAIKGIKAKVVNMSSLKPLDEEMIIKLAEDIGKIITVEEHNVINGLGSAVGDVILESGTGVKFKKIGVRDHFAKGYGSHEFMKVKNDLSIDEMVKTAEKMLERCD